MTVQLDPDLLTKTVQDLNEAMVRLKNDREIAAKQLETIDARIADIQQRCEVWTNHLRRLEAESNGQAARRRKGEGARVLLDFFEQLPDGKGLTRQEIVEQTGLPWSSVRRILLGCNGRFETIGSLWRLRKDEEIPV